MYLVAQTVQSPRGSTGTNVVMYRHHGQAAPIDWADPDLHTISSAHPGERVAEHVEVAPGGNAVVCYLDIAARDDITRAEIQSALDQLVKDIASNARCAALRGKVAAEFRITMGPADQALEHFTNLRAALLRLFDDPHQAARGLDAERLRIRVEVDEHRWRFTLDPNDRSRAPALVTSVTIPIDVADDFRELHGALEPHAAEWVTGLSREEILRRGGVQFVGAIARRWPE